MKYLSKIAFGIVLSLTFLACSNEDDSIILDENLNIIENSLSYKNSTYVLNEDLTTKKLENNNFSYNINVEDISSSSLLFKSNKNENELIIRNELTGEFIEIMNVQKYEDYYTFDLANNLGSKVEGFRYNGELFNDPVVGKCPPCVVVVVKVVVSAAIELLTDSPLEECTNAMNALDCGSGTPFMNFSEGWFSTTCSVGCH